MTGIVRCLPTNSGWLSSSMKHLILRGSSVISSYDPGRTELLTAKCARLSTLAIETSVSAE